MGPNPTEGTTLLEPNLRAQLNRTMKWAVATIAVITLVFTIGPRIEAQLLPPFARVSAALVGVGTDHVDVIVTGVKARRCVLTSALGESDIQGQHIKSQVIMLKEDGTQLLADEQRINLGSPFVRRVRVSPGGEHVRIIVESQCHPFWTVSQVIAEISTK